MNEESIRSEVWQAVLPLSRPIGTAIGEFRDVNAVVARLRDASGIEGCGYALAFDPPSFDHLANSTARLLAGQGGAAWRGSSASSVWPKTVTTGCEIGSHMFAHDSAHLLAALPDSMPVEVLDWWNLLFSEAPVPDASGRLAVLGPGLGRILRQEILERHGKKIA